MLMPTNSETPRPAAQSKLQMLYTLMTNYVVKAFVAVHPLLWQRTSQEMVAG